MGLENVIRDKISAKTNISPPFKIPSKINGHQSGLGKQRYISNHQNGHYSYIDNYYQKVLGWIPANPSKKQLIDAINSVYYFSKKQGAVANNIVNTKEGHIHFFLEIVNPKGRNTIFLQGAKGSGKTFYLNYLLNTKNRDLYSKHVIWFRAELSKLYKHNSTCDTTVTSSNQSELKKYTLEEYFRIQMAFVSFKYRDQNPIIQEIWEDKDGQISRMIIDLYNVEEEYKIIFDTPDKLLDEYAKFVNKIKVLENYADAENKFTKKEFRNLVWYHKLSTMSYIISKLILTYFRKNSFTPLFIIDGLDNIDYYNDRAEYELLTNQVKNFCLDGEKPNQFGGKVIVSVRDETISHLEVSARDFFESQTYPIFHVELETPEELLHKKISVAINPVCDHFVEKKKSVEEKIENSKKEYKKLFTEHDEGIEALSPEEFIEKDCNSILNFQSEFQSTFLSAISEKCRKAQIDEPITMSWIFKMFYNRNLRAFIHNFLHIHQYIRLFNEKKPLNNKNTSRPYLLIEGQLLNGALYLDSSERRFEFGKCIPNIFHFYDGNLCNAWHGLLTYRILQLLISITDASIIKLKNTMVDDFGYSEDVFIKNFYYAIGQGLITSNYDPKNKAEAYYITEKGQFMTQYLLLDVNILYYLAIDTPLSEHSINRSNFVKVHINGDNGYWENYTESCVLTSITFIRHILSKHTKEMQALKNKGFSDAQIKKYSLPDFFPNAIIQGMMKLISILSAFNQLRYEELKKNIEGLI